MNEEKNNKDVEFETDKELESETTLTDLFAMFSIIVIVAIVFYFIFNINT